MISDTDQFNLEVSLNDLGLRLEELKRRIDDDNDDAQRSLVDAIHHYNALARIIDPEQVMEDGTEDDEEIEAS